MAELMLVPEVAAGATEVVLAEWLVEAGETVEAGRALAVVETEKAVVEVEAEATAVLVRRLVDSGSTVAVGAPLALLGSETEAHTDPEEPLAPLGAAPLEATSPRPAEASPGLRQFVSPVARRLLRDAGLSPRDVRATGPHGRVVRRDAEAAIAAATATSPPPDPHATAEAPLARTSAPATWTDSPHSRARLAIARRLTESKRDIPHFYVKRSAQVDRLLELRRDVNRRSPVKTSLNDYVIRAVAVAHQAVPEANVAWAEDRVRSFDGVDVGVAIDSVHGLVAPVLRDVGRTSISAIAGAVDAHVVRANEGRLRQHDLEGGSISVSSLGSRGVDEFSAIINPPQSAILAVGAAGPAARVVDGEVVPVTVVSLVLSVDHRVIDGTLAARWMAALVDALEDPVKLLL